MSTVTLFTDKKSDKGNPYALYTLKYEASRVSKTKVSIKFTVSAHLEFSASSLGSSYFLNPAVKIGGTWYSIPEDGYLKDATTTWNGTTTHSKSRTLQLSVTDGDAGSFTSVEFRVKGYTGDSENCSIAATGNYTVKYPASPTSGIKFSESSGDGSRSFSTSSYTLDLLDATGSTATPTYAIKSQKNSSGSSVSYFSMSSSTADLTVKASTPAGTYTIVYTATDSGGTTHIGKTVSRTYTLTINKVAGSGSVTMNGWTYGGTVTTPTPSSSKNGTSGVTYTWYNSSKTKLSAKPTSTSAADTYYVKATFPATTNYNAYTTDYVSFVISKATTSITLTGSTSDYDTKSHTVTSTGGSGGTIYYRSKDSTSPTWGNWTTTKPSRTNAGTTNVEAKVVGDGNHTDSAVSTASIVINTVAASAPTLANVSASYDTNSHTIASTGGSGGTIYYRSKDSTSTTWSSWTTTKPSRTNAGTTNVEAKVVGDGNHTDSAVSTASIAIAKADNPIKFSTSEGTWTPTYSASSKRTVIVDSAGSAQGVVSYSIKSQPTGNYFTLDSSTRIITMKENTPSGEYTVVYEATAEPDSSSNYNKGTTTRTLKVTVAQATNPIALSNTAVNGITTQVLTTIYLSNYVTNAQGTLSYSVGTKSSNLTTGTLNAGTYTCGTLSTSDDNNGTISFTIVAAGNTNYKSGTVTLNVTVEKYTRTLKITNTATLKYLSTMSLVTSISGTGGTASSTISYSSSDTSVIALNGTTLTAKAASGSSVITATLSRTATVKQATATLNIVAEKATGKIILDKNSVTGKCYNNSTVTLSATHSGTFSVSNTTNSKIATTSISDKTLTIEHTSFGTTILTIKIPANTYYTEATATLTVNTERAINKLTGLSALELKYSGEAYDLSNWKSTYGTLTFSIKNTSIATITNSKINPVAVGDTTLTITCAETEQYEGLNSSCAITVIQTIPGFTIPQNLKIEWPTTTITGISVEGGGTITATCTQSGITAEFKNNKLIISTTQPNLSLTDNMVFIDLKSASSGQYVSHSYKLSIPATYIKTKVIFNGNTGTFGPNFTPLDTSSNSVQTEITNSDAFIYGFKSGKAITAGANYFTSSDSSKIFKGWCDSIDPSVPTAEWVYDNTGKPTTNSTYWKNGVWNSTKDILNVYAIWEIEEPMIESTTIPFDTKSHSIFDSSNNYTIDGSYSETEVGDYTAYATPKQYNVWKGTTSNSRKEYNWSIVYTPIDLEVDLADCELTEKATQDLKTNGWTQDDGTKWTCIVNAYTPFISNVAISSILDLVNSADIKYIGKYFVGLFNSENQQININTVVPNLTNRSLVVTLKWAQKLTRVIFKNFKDPNLTVIFSHSSTNNNSINITDDSSYYPYEPYDKNLCSLVGIYTENNGGGVKVFDSNGNAYLNSEDYWKSDGSWNYWESNDVVLNLYAYWKIDLEKAILNTFGSKLADSISDTAGWKPIDSKYQTFSYYTATAQNFLDKVKNVAGFNMTKGNRQKNVGNCDIQITPIPGYAFKLPDSETLKREPLDIKWTIIYQKIWNPIKLLSNRCILADSVSTIKSKWFKEQNDNWYLLTYAHTKISESCYDDLRNLIEDFAAGMHLERKGYKFQSIDLDSTATKIPDILKYENIFSDIPLEFKINWKKLIAISIFTKDAQGDSSWQKVQPYIYTSAGWKRVQTYIYDKDEGWVRA